jgi:multidrug resistance efflux pump
MKLPADLKPSPWQRRGITLALVGVAAVMVGIKVWDYMRNPWTRDAQVRANVVQITTRVSGPIIRLPIRDNQAVKAGQLLFEIDPRTFTEQVNQARAELDNTRDELESLARQVDVARAGVKQAESVVIQRKSALRASKAQFTDAEVNFRRAAELIRSGSISRKDYDDESATFRVAEARRDEAAAAVLKAEKDLLQAEASLAEAIARLGAPGDANAQLRAAKATLRDAELNLDFTRVKAPVSGYVTNLNLRLGSQTVANQPALALLDQNSHWIEAYFRETWIGRVQPGDQAVVTLMSYPNKPLTGTVESIGWGISKDNGSTGEFLLPNVNPTFEWIRLAQRIPVRIMLDKLPPGVVLRLGSTASVLVKTGSSENPPIPNL